VNIYRVDAIFKLGHFTVFMRLAQKNPVSVAIQNMVIIGWGMAINRLNNDGAETITVKGKECGR
jgi:hypothetical protein